MQSCTKRLDDTDEQPPDDTPPEREPYWMRHRARLDAEREVAEQRRLADRLRARARLQAAFAARDARRAAAATAEATSSPAPAAPPELQEAPPAAPAPRGAAGDRQDPERDQRVERRGFQLMKRRPIPAQSPAHAARRPPTTSSTSSAAERASTPRRGAATAAPRDQALPRLEILAPDATPQILHRRGIDDTSALLTHVRAHGWAPLRFGRPRPDRPDEQRANQGRLARLGEVMTCKLYDALRARGIETPDPGPRQRAPAGWTPEEASAPWDEVLACLSRGAWPSEKTHPGAEGDRLRAALRRLGRWSAFKALTPTQRARQEPTFRRAWAAWVPAPQTPHAPALPAPRAHAG